MNDLNQVCLIGNLTRDCEAKYFQDGSCAVRFSIAVNGTKKEGNEYVDDVSYFDVKVYGKTAENLIQFLKKGKKVGISGKLKQERWLDNSGNNRSAVCVVAGSINLLSGIDKPKPAPNYQNDNQGNGYQNGYAHQGSQGGSFEEDIPF